MQSLEDIPIQYIKGVGPNRKKLFANLGVESVEDLLYLFPRRYEDRTKMTPINKVKLGEWQTVYGKVLKKTSRKSWHTRKHVLEVVIGDGLGALTCVWFNMPFLDHYFKKDEEVVLYGKADRYKDRIQMVSPEYEILGSDDNSLNTGRIVPVYPLTKGITQRSLRKVIHAAIDKYKESITDLLPVKIRNKHRFINLKRSLMNVHFPDSEEMQQEAVRRISFEEFFFFQVSVVLRRQSITAKEGVAHTITDDLVKSFTDMFPFSLTKAQEKVIAEISLDLKKPVPMLRLLQGDVGSGKTLVALFGCIAAYENGCQAAFMAPTEILARQHYENISQVLGVRGQGPDKSKENLIPKTCNLAPNVVLLTSSLSKKEQDEVREQIKAGEADIVIGTHALLSEQVEFKDLSFIVIDEQHKFGVRQRALLSEKGNNPDVLVMTATPIPRTLTMTLFGDLDVSIIDELPKDRGQITTVLHTLDKAEGAYKIVAEKLQKGQQAYVVYPIIEESEKVDLKAAESMYEQFKKKEFKGFKVGLVHGRMKRGESDEVMNAFKNKELDILVATTVLEVGVDVPNANVMVIEHAERFGLSQLHQLRGRVGRSMDDALCLLIADPVTAEGNARLEALLSTTNGFKIAECDLMIRGPGQYFGRHQHGLNELRLADPLKQIDILEAARGDAIELIKDDPFLDNGAHSAIKETIQKRYPAYLGNILAG